MNVYTAECPSCLTPVEWCDGEQLEQCCDGAVLRQVRRLLEQDTWPPKRETWRQLRRAVL